MPKFDSLLYETPEPGIARIWLNRPDRRNAQDTDLLYELNAAYEHAAADNQVKVILLAAKGPHFSAGHDLQEGLDGDCAASMARHRPVGLWSGEDCDGVDAYYCREKEIYEGFCLRWRDIPKPTIASVHGKAISGALMLIWPCDLVVATESATFQDNTMFMGIPGAEYFAHAWELGIRRAKEFLFTGQPLSAREAWQAGMVNRVVADDALERESLAMARQVADKPALALKLAKQALNSVYSAQGFDNVQMAAFNAHHLAHTHYRLTQDGSLIDRAFVERFRAGLGSGRNDPA